MSSSFTPPTPLTSLLNVLTTVSGEGWALTHGRIPFYTINVPDECVNERKRTKGINAAEPVVRVTTMTSWVSWKPGMNRLWATPPKHTHTHTHSEFLDNWSHHGNTAVSLEESALACRSQKKAVVFGILGHAFRHTFLTTINCVIAETTASFLNTFHHKTASSQTKPHANLLNLGDKTPKRLVGL